MRKIACDGWVKLFESRPFVFLTGDVGFGVLEPLREAMGERFINAGLAEQNMVSVAAGLARQGLDAWVYSIAPFCYARPFEQIRNDVCLHSLPVKLVGNGGGYGYGAMGATHHALEDYGALLGLQGMHVFVPAFADDVAHLIPELARFPYPAYLRLGRCEKPEDFELPEYAPWRRLLSGEGPVVVAVGPLVGGLLALLRDLDPERRPELWVLTELPLEANPIPLELMAGLQRAQRLCVVEEHVEHGGVGPMLAHFLLKSGTPLEAFEHVSALGYPSGDYGSQQFHRKECGLDPQSLLKRIEELGSRP
jgi:transketolase